jgi:hypothetical protein
MIEIFENEKETNYEFDNFKISLKSVKEALKNRESKEEIKLFTNQILKII